MAVAAAFLVAVVAVSGLATAVSTASAAPLPPLFTSPLDGATTVSTTIPVSVAIAASGDDIEITVFANGSPVPSCPATVLDYTQDTFSCDVVVPGPGVYDLTASAINPNDAAGGSTEALDPPTVTVGGTDGALLGYSESGTVWNSVTPELSGTGPAFGQVEVELLAGEGSWTYCVVPQVPASGEWTCTAANAPGWTWGDVDLRAYGTDVTGNPTADDQIVGEFVPPAPTSQIVLGPASITFSAQGARDSFFQMRLYEVTLNGEGSSFIERATCDPEGSPPTVSCALTGLAPGVWNLYTVQDFEERYFEGLDEYVRIPSSPTGFGATVLDDRSVRFSGQGVPGFRVSVRDGEGDVCSVIVGSNSRWQCTVNPAVGTASYRSVQQSVGFDTNDFEVFSDRSLDGFSALTSAISVTVPPAVAAPRPAPPAVAQVPAPLSWVLEGYDGSPLIPGQQLTLSASGLPIGTDIVVEIRSTPQVLGATVVDDAGAFELEVVVPSDLEPGSHTLVAIATPPGGVASPVSIPVVVIEPAENEPVKETVNANAPEKLDGSGTGSGGSTGGSLDRSNPSSPSAITASIPTLQRVINDPWVVLASGGLALAILLLVAFPAELLTSTLSANSGRLGRWFVALERRTDQVTEWFTRVSRTRALAAAVLVGLTSLIFGFVDPDYGFDPVSIRMTVSLAIGLFLITYVAAWIAGAIARRAWGVETEVTLQPVALLFAVVGVVVARILEFSPGFLIGLVIGLDLISRVEARVRARVVLLSTGVVVGVALAAWFAFSALTAVSTGQPGWVELLISDTLVATTAEGLTAALAALLPLGFLAGYDVFRYSKPLWGVSFLVTGALFALIVLPTAAGETADVTDVAFWILVMVIFAVVTLTLWAVLQFTGRGQGHDESETSGNRRTFEMSSG